MPLQDQPRIVQLRLATVTLPDWHPEAASDPACDVYGYAVDHPDGVIVFDTGVGAGNDLIDEMFSPKVSLLDHALRHHGMELDSVVAVVNSHLHFDHCGQNPLLYESDVPFFVGRAEIDAVQNDPMYTIAEWALPPESQRELVSNDLAIAEGVTVLTAPGHTAGHTALLVESADDRVIIGGQAVWNLSEFVDEIATKSNVDDELRDAAVDTMQRMKSFNPSVVYFSHCDHYTAPSAEPAC